MDILQKIDSILNEGDLGKEVESTFINKTTFKVGDKVYSKTFKDEGKIVKIFNPKSGGDVVTIKLDKTKKEVNDSNIEKV